MPCNTNAGQDGVSTTSNDLLEYLLRVFQPCDSPISNSVIQCNDDGASVLAKKAMKAST